MIAPSHIPKIIRHMSRPAKFFAAAWHISATPHINIFTLKAIEVIEFIDIISSENKVPHPFPYGKFLQCKILRILKDQVAEIENSGEPIELVGVNIC